MQPNCRSRARSLKDDGIDAIAFTGHKEPARSAGSAAWSSPSSWRRSVLGRTEDRQQERPAHNAGFLPDKFEAGTQGLVGIIGLSAAMDYIRRTGRPSYSEKRRRPSACSPTFSEERLQVMGPKGMEGRTSVISVDFPSWTTPRSPMNSSSMPALKYGWASTAPPPPIGPWAPSRRERCASARASRPPMRRSKEPLNRANGYWTASSLSERVKRSSQRGGAGAPPG